MNNLGGQRQMASNGIDENILPTDLQTKNTVTPGYVLSAPQQTVNGSVRAASTVKGPDQPFVVITEQPQQRGFRFRYECEGPSHGGLQGTKSERSRKSYPSIKIENYSGAARVVVSLVTDEKNPRSHAHKLVGTNCKNGLCTVEVPANLDTISFPNLSILHVTRRRLVDVLTERILDTIKLNKKLKVNNMNLEPTITDEDQQTARKQAEEQSKTMQLNVVRLCFQVFLRNPDGSLSKLLTPVVSQLIYDSKSPGASALKICRMDKYGGCCSGNEEVFLLCEKVQKDDIQVRFVEQNPDGSVKWEALGNFGPLDVHRQYAIVFKTPAYYNTNIDKPVNVLIMLQRKSDQEVSEPKAFTYFPQNRDKDNIASKKRKRIPLDGYDFGEGGLGGSGLGGDPGGGSGQDGGEDGDGSQPMMVYQSTMTTNNLSTGPARIPQPVTQVLDEQKKEKEDEQQRQQTVDSVKKSSNIQFSGSDAFVGDEDSADIEVDSAVMPTLPQDSVFHKDEPFDHKGKEKGQSPDVYGGSSNSGPRSNMTPPKPLVEPSLEWMDSGVISDASRSIISFEEGFEQKCQIKEPGSAALAGGVRDRKPSSTSDQPSEPDAKTVVSEGVRSDEGFSETLEEAVVKIQPTKSKLPSAPCEQQSSHCSQLTDTMRQVTGRVAERTLSALADYAETGDIRHLLLVQRHLIPVSNENGDLPLHLAIINSQADALKSLLDVTSTLPESGRFINAQNLLRQTPLHLATIMQDQRMVEMLLHCGADPSIADHKGNTPAHLAVIYHSYNCLQSLVKYLRPGTSKLDPFPELNYLNYDGYSPVHLAAVEGSVDMLHTLVFGKADVCLPDGKSGKTALHHAVENDDLPVAGYLLMEAHTYVDARTFDGNTALHISCARQLVGMVALLVAAGANVNCENEEIPDPETTNDEEVWSADRRGMRPMDYADDNELIIQLLLGEVDPSSYQWSVSDLVQSDNSKSLLSEESLLKPFSLSSSAGMSKVTPQSLQHLSRLLDPTMPGQDVLALAHKLGYTQLNTALEGARSGGSSATSFLLEYIEANEGNLDRLKSGLLAIDREDIVGSLSLYD